NSVIVAQTGISGSTRVGERVMMGGQVGIVGHLEIGDGTAIGAQSGVSKSTLGGAWFGSPAVPLEEAKQQIAWIHRLGKLFERVKVTTALLLQWLSSTTRGAVAVSNY